MIDEKTQLRRRMRKVLDAMTPEERARSAVAIAQPLVDRVLAVKASLNGPVALFASLPHEIGTAPLDEALRTAGIERAFPAVEGDDLVFRVVDVAAHAMPRAVMGIPTPPASARAVALGECRAVIVPGLAFDASGSRIGYGRGFYDRALRGLDPERVVGVCFDQQLVERVPVDDGDVKLRWLCTPGRGVFRAAS